MKLTASLLATIIAATAAPEAFAGRQIGGASGDPARKLMTVRLDEQGDEITKHYIRPGHPNDGNEGNEGNEGNSSPPSSPPSSYDGKYDELGDEITPWYIRPGHPNDGNEGNEGNEGKDSPRSNPSTSPPTSSPPSPTHDGKYDELGDEITPWYIRPGHPNDGNEGNEGNEGDDSRSSTPTPTSTPPSSSPPSNSKGMYDVCVSGSYTNFGRVEHKRPEGIRVYSSGRCELMEYAGGFDGYFSVDAGDGHEDEFARAVALMLRDSGAKIGKSAGSNNPANRRVNAFMKELRDRSKPTDWDYPQDIAIADGGGRMRNIDKVSAVCTEMINVRQC